MVEASISLNLFSFCALWWLYFYDVHCMLLTVVNLMSYIYLLRCYAECWTHFRCTTPSESCYVHVQSVVVLLALQCELFINLLFCLYSFLLTLFTSTLVSLYCIESGLFHHRRILSLSLTAAGLVSHCLCLWIINILWRLKKKKKK